MEISADPNSSTSWFEFLLERNLLRKHLQKEDSEPSPLSLLKQFLSNVAKCGGGGLEEEKENSDGVNTEAEKVPKVNPERFRKSRTLKMMALQIAAHLNWDLDIFSKMDLGEQNLLMRQICLTAKEAEDTDKSYAYFLRVLYHRWVLRTIQANAVKFNRSSTLPPHIMALQAEQDALLERTLKEFNAEESQTYLSSFLPPGNKDKTKIYIPILDTFAEDCKPDWNKGTQLPRKSFESLIRVDLGTYLLYKGSVIEATTHFKAQSLPNDFIYLRISKPKLNGYLKALEIKPGEKEKKLNKVEQKDGTEMVNSLADILIKGDLNATKKSLGIEGDFDQFSISPLDPAQRDSEEGLEGTDSVYQMEKRLIESSDADEIKGLLMRLHQCNLGIGFHKFFSDWELPIPVQNATLSIPMGPLQDFIYILIAKSKQLFGIKLYKESKEILALAISEIQLQLGSGMTTYLYNLTKLVKMLEWEILLIDISDLIENWSRMSSNDTQNAELIRRCRECLGSLQNQSSEVNPRSEIVENVLMILVNLGEFQYVANFELNQRWPFVEFLSLLARACSDLAEGKDASSNYRDLWGATLPIFSNTSIPKLKTSKASILSNQSILLWVINRSRSHSLVSLWVSLLSRLHNHISDDIGLQITTEYLHIWPNILDDVTAGATPELKLRVSGGSKLNSGQIRESLLHLLQRTLVCTKDVIWLKIIGDLHMSGNPATALKSYLEYLALSTEFYERMESIQWGDNSLFRRMIKCCELLQCYTQALIFCQFLTDVDYSMAFGMAQEKVTLDASDGLYGFIWDPTILEFLINIHTRRNELHKRGQAIRVMGLLELNANNSEEIKKEAIRLRKSQFLRSLAKLYIFV